MHVYSLIRFATLQLGCRVVPGLQNLQLVSKLGWLKCAPRWALMWAKKCKKIWLLLDAKLFHYGQFVKINLFKVCNLTLKNLGLWEVFFFFDILSFLIYVSFKWISYHFLWKMRFSAKVLNVVLFSYLQIIVSE